MNCDYSQTRQRLVVRSLRNPSIRQIRVQTKSAKSLNPTNPSSDEICEIPQSDKSEFRRNLRNPSIRQIRVQTKSAKSFNPTNPSSDKQVYCSLLKREGAMAVKDGKWDPDEFFGWEFRDFINSLTGWEKDQWYLAEAKRLAEMKRQRRQRIK